MFPKNMGIGSRWEGERYADVPRAIFSCRYPVSSIEISLRNANVNESDPDDKKLHDLHSIPHHQPSSPGYLPMLHGR